MGRLDNQQNKQTVGRLPKATTITPTVKAKQQPATGFLAPLRNAPSNIKALARGEFSVGDVASEMPGVVGRNAKKAAETFAPASTNFVKTVGGISGEGLAYAADKNVREQYKAGNLDILPTITKTTQKGLLRDTVAAGIEAAIMRGIPGGITGKVATRAAVGGLEGIGFAIAEGMAKDQSVDEIIGNAKLYGVSGSILNTALPWLGPLLRKEIGRAPKEVITALKKEINVPPVKAEVPPVSEEATSVISYIDKNDQKVYTTITNKELAALKDEVKVIPTPGKGESQIHLDAKTPRLESQGKLVSRDEFIKGHSQAGDVLGSTKVPVISKEVPVQGEQIPIGGPTQGASKLEARLVAQAEDPSYKAGVDNYKKYSNAADAPEITGSTNIEQIKRATSAIESMTPNQVNDIVSGYAPLPEGVLRTAFIKAATEKALLEGNATLVARLGRVVGQAARRFGQEIQFTKNFDPLDPVTNIADLLSVRLKAAEQRLPKGRTVRNFTEETVTKAKKETSASQLKIQQAEELLNSILC